MSEPQSNDPPSAWGIIAAISVGIYLLIFSPVLLIFLILKKEGSISNRLW